MEIRTELLNFVHADLLDGEVEVSAQDLLLEDGLVDSIGLMRLVGHIESTLGCTVPLDHIVLEHFASIDAVMDYLRSAGHVSQAA